MTKSKSRWVPVLTGNLKTQAWQYIEKLDLELDELEKKLKNEPSFHLFTAGTGAGLFSHYLYLVSGDKKHQRRAKSFGVMASDAIGRVPVADTLTAGFTAAAWVAEHFRNENKKKWPAGKDPHGEVDDYLISKIRDGKSLGRYGLLDDWIGYGAYGLERWPHGDSTALLGELVHFLNSRVETVKGGNAWFTTKTAMPAWERKLYSGGYYNLGVAHGNAGVMGFLAEALKRNIRPEVTGNLLENSVKWILAQDTDKHYGFNVPGQKKGIGKKSVGRLAWCYGDLGMCVVLLNAAKVLKDPVIEKKALAVAHRARVFPRSQDRVADPFICHGGAGAFHIFNRLYQETGDRRFLQCSLKWAKETFKLIKAIEGQPEIEYNIYTGKTGIGLSLLAGISKMEPRWDRILLMSSSI